MSDLISNGLRNYKTTLLGVALAVIAVVQGSNKGSFQAALSDGPTQIALAAAVAAFLAKDADKVGTVPGTINAAKGSGPGVTDSGA